MIQTEAICTLERTTRKCTHRQDHNNHKREQQSDISFGVSISLQTCIHFKAEQKRHRGKRKETSTTENDAVKQQLFQPKREPLVLHPPKKRRRKTSPACEKLDYPCRTPRSPVISPCSRPVYLTACIPLRTLALYAGAVDGASALSYIVRCA